MTLSERWRAFCKPYMDIAMMWARRNSEVSHEEYKRLREQYDRMYK